MLRSEMPASAAQIDDSNAILLQPPTVNREAAHIAAS
jgi:hypothetical protein